ncbi:MAG: N(4)-acetylcytidine aminohydrolase [Ewingella americana]|uniref:N(4)-acetylcytidine aminohydrolase n=1 Tax=Ewingella americana TaxID=41202 RepID=UPI002431828D|nr:N(4)-acetylcytidine aminohydrolase [Ewingella americana]MCI1678481.1 N(4)-acetylcytidine aminohydrolase [Ewingella americana]MCI1854068.1 N(4)-acetylcytidine aminohydrolase [Ewingella americana]MCI1861368.1 N(4)-acetylcytidine aminohydrolase [Ewingella americana]MCI2143485.1 N(4)-acetylcytidine aminohydrolase [Ewingella americana]MCI2163649.1 N(4)-acetylcytidine aminohydrolase [Ewingella americana]
MKNITFFSRFETDILAERKTITLREASDAQFSAGDKVRVSRYEDQVFFCNIEVIAVTPVLFSELNQRHADQENMTLAQLREVISEIYPGLNELFMIEFRLLK